MKRLNNCIGLTFLFTVIIFTQILYAQDPFIENPRLNPQLMKRGIKGVLPRTVLGQEKRSTLQVPKDWNHWIDSAWGDGLSTSQKLNIFDAFWDTVDQRYGGFVNLNVNWDSLRDYYRPLVEAGISRGRFYGIMTRMTNSLQEQHTRVSDNSVDSSFYFDMINLIYWWPYERVPLSMMGGWGVTTSGMGLAPMPDSSLFVYRSQPGNPLGMQAGDIVLGYDGRKWKDILHMFDSVEVPVARQFSFIGSDPEAYAYSRLNAASLNWFMFDTIDVVRYSTGDTVHLSTQPLADAPMFWDSLMCMDHIEVPGVPTPDVYNGQWCSWGIVQGTSIGYIYLWSELNQEIGNQFSQAVQELVNTTSGLIIDMRGNWGGTPKYFNEGFSYLFNENPDANMDLANRSSTTDHFAFTHEATSTHYAFGPFEPTPDIYDHPMAVLTGPGAVSCGDWFALRFKFHPMVRFFGKRTNTAYVDGHYSQGTLVQDPWTHKVSKGSVYSISDGGGFMIHKGFNVDEEVWHNRDDAANGIDHVVERAVEWVNGLSYSHDIKINRDTLIKMSDSITVTASVENPGSHTLVVSAIVTNASGTQVDSVILFDDGIHGDSASGDGTWGTFINSPGIYGTYNISIRTEDQTAGSYRRLTDVASFLVLPNAIIETSPPGLTFTVDGTNYSTQQNYSWAVGSTHSISTTSPVGAGSTRWVFSNWSDGGGISHMITAPDSSTTYTAVFIRQQKLTTTILPSGSGSISTDPVSVDGYYNTGTSVQLTAISDTGYTFTNWSDGDLTGSVNPQSLTMSAARNVTANFSVSTNQIITIAGPHGTISPQDTVVIQWGGSQRFIFMPDPGYYVDSVIVDGEPVDSSDGYTFTNVFEPHMIRVVFASLTTVEWTVNEQWNLISLPVQVLECLTDSLFGSAISDAYEYDGQYISRDTLVTGKGYWLKFSVAESQSLSGNCIVSDTIDVKEGWNLIGSISYPIPVTTIKREDTTITTSNFFGYDGSYFSADTIYPGRGYWVKVNKNGKLILSSLQHINNSHFITIIRTTELPPAPPGGKESVMANEIPDEYLLEQNYPNPFNPTTTFKFGIPERSRITFEIYNVLGQIVTTLINGECESGYHSMEWIATNGIGSGLYFYRLTASSMVKPGRMFVQVRKMVVVR